MVRDRSIEGFIGRGCFLPGVFQRLLGYALVFPRACPPREARRSSQSSCDNPRLHRRRWLLPRVSMHNCVKRHPIQILIAKLVRFSKRRERKELTFMPCRSECRDDIAHSSCDRRLNPDYTVIDKERNFHSFRSQRGQITPPWNGRHMLIEFPRGSAG